MQHNPVVDPKETARPVLLVDPKEAKRLLTVSSRKLWSMTFEEDPPLPHIKLGRLVRYSLADLQRAIDARRKGGNSDDAS